MNTCKAFLGDAEREFGLPLPLLKILERKVDAGIGTLCKRVFAGHFRATDLIETIRYGLIGGDTPPQEADALIDAFVVDRPIHEVLPVAFAILETCWFGAVTKPEQPADAATEDEGQANG